VVLAKAGLEALIHPWDSARKYSLLWILLSIVFTTEVRLTGWYDLTSLGDLPALWSGMIIASPQISAHLPDLNDWLNNMSSSSFKVKKQNAFRKVGGMSSGPAAPSRRMCLITCRSSFRVNSVVYRGWLQDLFDIAVSCCLLWRRRADWHLPSCHSRRLLCRCDTWLHWDSSYLASQSSCIWPAIPSSGLERLIGQLGSRTSFVPWPHGPGEWPLDTALPTQLDECSPSGIDCFFSW